MSMNENENSFLFVYYTIFRIVLLRQYGTNKLLEFGCMISNTLAYAKKSLIEAIIKIIILNNIH